MTNDVATHYGTDGLLDRILAALTQAGKDLNHLTIGDLGLVDEFHSRRRRATEELARMLAPSATDHVIDVGSGLGGPSRYLAATYGCRVSGVDLIPEFVTTSTGLTERVGLTEKVDFRQGSALALPFPDTCFDLAWSQNVAMNIEDKLGMYREAFRALRPGGRLALSNLCAGAKGDLHFPVPWAQTPATSFLATPDQMRADLLAAGFEIVAFRDTTAETLPATIRNRERLEREGLPRLGTHLIIGDRLLEMQVNSARNIEEGRGATIEALARKPV